MVWFRVDDKMHSHRKARKAGVAAIGLWAITGSWCADQLTDGFVPDYIAASFDPEYADHAERLVASGLWHRAEQDGDTGWRFHEWEGRNPMRSDVERKREEARDRMARGRANRRESSEDVRANSERSSDQVPLTPVPVPDPVVPTELRPRPEVAELCTLLADKIEANGSKRPTIGKGWHDAMRRLIDLDGKSPQQVRNMIEWSQADPFWKANILSAPKLREKYDQMRLQATQQQNPGKAKPRTIPPFTPSDPPPEAADDPKVYQQWYAEQMAAHRARHAS